MARTLEQIDAELDALRAQRGNPTRGTRVGDIGVDYRDDPDLASSIAALERERARALGRRRPRMLNVQVEKGL